MRRVLYDLAALITRLLVGVVFVAHGWQKMTAGWGRITEGFTEMGVPLPQLAAGFAMVAELLGGALLILGLLTPLAGAALVIVCIGAALFVHARNGVFIGDGGWELVGALGSAALLLAAGGAGRFSLDHLLFGRRTERARRAADSGYPAPAAAWYDPDVTPTEPEVSQPGHQEGRPRSTGDGSPDRYPRPDSGSPPPGSHHDAR
jgi:putative oxidoreductase